MGRAESVESGQVRCTHFVSACTYVLAYYRTPLAYEVTILLAIWRLIVIAMRYYCINCRARSPADLCRR
jgi:hypothetical protein